MHIHQLTMKSFRGFEDATLDLDRPLTVLFGANGSGKSSVLVGIASAVSEMIVEPGQWSHVADDIDIRAGSAELQVRLTASNGGLRRDIHVKHRRGETRPPKILAGGLSQLLHAAPWLVVFYDASRSVATSKEAFATPSKRAGPPDLQPFSPHYDTIVAGYLKFRSFFQWFHAREDIENELKVSRANLSLEDPQLSAVRRAVASMLPGFSGLRVQRDPLHLVIRKGKALLLLDQLSDGEKLLLVLAADLARRLAMAYPGSADPLGEEGVVLIDEIELHLHPAWQRRALSALRNTFPKCQFVVTTHSPQVLSEVPNEAVVLVHDFQFVRPSAPTAGRDSNAILTEVMGTTERPSEKLEEIRQVSSLIDEGKLAAAREKLDELSFSLSELDREVVGLRTMLHFLDGGEGRGDEADPKGQ